MNEKIKNNYWKQIVIVSTLGWIVVWLNRTALTPIYPQLSEYFGGATDAKIGAISSFYFLGYVLMQIPSGILVDKFGKKTVLIPGFLLFALGTLLLASSKNLNMMYFGNVLAGVGSGTFYGVAFSLTNEYVPSKYRSVATAVVNCGTAIGSGIGMIASSYFVSQLGLPWQYMEWASLITILLMTVVFVFYIKKDNPQVQTINSNGIEEVEKKLTTKELFAPKMIGAYSIYFATCYAYYLVNTWLPNFLETERGFEGATIGLASSLIFVSSVPGALIFSRIADRYTDKKVELAVFLEIVAAASLYLAVMSTNKNILMLGLLLYGFFGKVVVEPIIISWLGEQVPRKGLATTLGVFNFLGMSSSVIAPSLTGKISDMTGSKINAFYISIVILIIGTTIFYLTNKLKESKEVSI
ncbi:MFS transporter [Vagococcus fluvialis]|uniref:MFS transporter n=1 Tax=Vagococcus fluvialis TaxID=2738 RepID=A0A369B3K5_9ENTE|nr:MFS transporter [Vagococcus fluvialis]MDR2276418.1 MFS transporter [Vagococcus sp.]MBO0442305.1 MFS transporter [Vagococcus fluvialis]MDT2746738.1 MFS transporter [Vagococcus fluvialis]NKC68597.1 MFS transporter [Vagococcus fluvialis]RCX16011.1 sugar phosphate permease [Vagococcus fluvialis]